MTRAEMRRKQKEKEKNTKVYQLTEKQLQEIRNKDYQEIRKNLMKKIDLISEQVFKMMLVIPTNVLINDYWEKTAEKRIPKFVDDCLSLYSSLQSGTVSMKEMQDMTEKYSKIKLIDLDSETGKILKKYN